MKIASFIHNKKYLIASFYLVMSLSCSGDQDVKEIIAMDQKTVLNEKSENIRNTSTNEVIETSVPTPELDSLFIYNSAVLALRIEEYNDAVNNFTRVIRRMPNLAIAYKGRAAAYYRDGRTELAIEDLQKALSIDITLGGAHFYLGMIYKDQGDLQKAREELTLAVNMIHPIREKWELNMAREALFSIKSD